MKGEYIVSAIKLSFDMKDALNKDFGFLIIFFNILTLENFC